MQKVVNSIYNFFTKKYFYVQNKQKYLKYIYIFAAFCNVLLNYLLIPILGSVGAAIASLITQILTTMIVPFFIKPLRKNSILMVEAIFFKGVK